ncbi:unnamed protein product [Microthlaspi erraticum]|uniref:Uncharacterized protein n=1 Tax=Microthlaspi erraticum TaxID=1685480 RepID=A0A6D2HU05_9BRAS|nr:unnamed protein product [Microthlaspi erraticum]
MFRARPKPYSVRLKSRPKSNATRPITQRSAKLQRFTPLRARPTRASRETKPRGRATRSAYHGRCIRPSRERTSHVRPRPSAKSIRPTAAADHETIRPRPFRLGQRPDCPADRPDDRPNAAVDPKPFLKPNPHNSSPKPAPT